MWPKTELIDLLKITHPIIQAPMAGASTPELVAAVSNAGGLGSYGGAATPPAQLRQVIRQIRELTDQPFSVNLFAPAVEAYQLTPELQTPMSELLTKWHNELDAGPVPEPIPIVGPFVDQLTVLLEEKIPVFSFHFGSAPIEAIREIHAMGSIVLATATTVREAKALVVAGVDVIIAQGFEAGGHRGTFAVPYEHGLIGTAALVPQVADAVSVPVVAAGGIMDARGIVAAFALGASGVQMGTAFLACPENNIPEVYRQAVLMSKDEDTVITEVFSGKPARAIRNRFIREMENHRDKLLPFPAQMSIGRVLRQTSAQQSSPDFVSMWAGQGAALVDVARAVSVILDDPASHIGHVYNLTGFESADLNHYACVFSEALGRTIRYRNVPLSGWTDTLREFGVPTHLINHLAVMAELHVQERYDRMTDDLFKLTGKMPTSLYDFVKLHAAKFTRSEVTA